MGELAYPVAAQRKSALALMLCVAGLGAACSAGVKPTTAGAAGTGGASGPGAGGTQGSAGNPGNGGSTPPIGGFGGIVINPDAGACQMKQFMFEPKIPTVILVVDRSGSMFDCISTTSQVEPSCATLSDTAWVKLKDGILPVVQSLEKDVRFGFATITGSNPSAGGSCPMLNPVAPKLMNYNDIAAVYNGLPPGPNSNQPGMKFETPTRQVLQMVGAQLMADTTPGDKYILFVTDGEPDYCGDGNALCPPDGVVWQLQTLKAAGITTLVFGIKATIAQDLPMGVLEAFANAGKGEPTVVPLRTGATRIEDVFDQCFNPGGNVNDAQGGWTTDFLSVPANAPCMADRNSCRGRTLGVYSPTAGPTTPYRPDVTNQQALIAQLSSALAGVKSCVFDLTPVKVDLNQLNKAGVLIEGMPVPLDTTNTNGWNMTSDIQLTLFGSACEAWRNPNAKTIDFNFPCEIIVD